SKKLAKAAQVMSRFPAAIQLRFLQTAVEVAAENNSTTIFPVPVDLFTGLLGRRGPAAEDAGDDLLELEEGDDEPLLPEGAERELLAETAKSILGLHGSTAEAEEAPALGAGADEEEEDAEE
ncbi:slipin family protein, partial [Gemmatimonadota bacterium]